MYEERTGKCLPQVEHIRGHIRNSNIGVIGRPSLSDIITGFVTRLTRRVSLVEQELLTLPEHLSSPPVRVTRSLDSGAAGMLLHINGKLTMGKLKLFLLS
jgi:hypothetical protein